MHGDAPVLISTANVIIPQSYSAEAETTLFDWGVISAPSSYKIPV
jgi:hypothetical protein